MAFWQRGGEDLGSRSRVKEFVRGKKLLFTSVVRVLT